MRRPEILGPSRAGRLSRECDVSVTSLVTSWQPDSGKSGGILHQYTRFGTEGSEVQILSPRPLNRREWPQFFRIAAFRVSGDVAQDGAKWAAVGLDKQALDRKSDPLPTHPPEPVIFRVAGRSRGRARGTPNTRLNPQRVAGMGINEVPSSPSNPGRRTHLSLEKDAPRHDAFRRRRKGTWSRSRK
jgi:hypothetical protein